MLENNIFRQISAKFLLKTKAALLWRLSFRMRSFAKDYLQDFNQNVGEVLT